MTFFFSRQLAKVSLSFFAAAAAAAALTTADAIDCTGKLVRTVSGPSSTCDGFETSTNAHYWPLVDGCHGWKATAIQDGRVHENSANNIRCSEDGTRLLYDQWPASLDCTDVGLGFTSKEFVLNECHQGNPPRLYDMGINLDCCLNPQGDSCIQSYTGVPRINGAGTADEEIYWNGERCDDEIDGEAMTTTTDGEEPSTSPVSPPTTVDNDDNESDNASSGPQRSWWTTAGWWCAVVALVYGLAW